MKIDRMKQEWMLNLVTIIDKNKQAISYFDEPSKQPINQPSWTY